MTPRRPASPASEAACVILPADQYPSAGGLLLEVTLEAEHLIALSQHPLIHRTMRFVACRAPLSHRFMLKYKRASLRNVAFAARLLLR